MSGGTGNENSEITMQELIQGIGRLVIKLNESVQKVEKRVEDLQQGLSGILEESFKNISAELARSNDFLAEMVSAGSVGGEKANLETSAPAAGDMLRKLEDIGVELAGIREDMGNTRDGLLEVLTRRVEDAVSKEQFGEAMDKLSENVSESARIVEASITEVIGKSSKQRDRVLEENLGMVVEKIEEITGKVGDAEDAIRESMEDIRKETVREVSEIGGKVEENGRLQREQLENMKGLLAVHSVEVRDNRVRDLNRRAIIHFNNAEYDQALAALKEAIESDPENPELLANMAHVEASMGDLEAAEGHFKKALDMNPDLEPAISGLGTVMMMSGRTGDSIDFLQKYLEDGENTSVGAMVALSRAYSLQGEHAKALELLKKAEKVAPEHPELVREFAKYGS